MQRYKVFEDRWHPVKDDEGRYYLVSEVDAALAEKDVARLRRAGCECPMPLVGGRPDGRVRCRLCNREEPDNEQIATLTESCNYWKETALQGEEESHESTPQSEQERTEFICSGDDNRNRRSIGKHHRGRR